ncbi:nmrA-like family domain-containing protein 1 isoform X2 [Lissotriton helveticus]
MACKTIAVFGATGAQGGSVARALLKCPGFAVRAVTRDVSRPAAIALRDLGAEVVKGDLDDKEAVEKILKGVYGAFLVTNFYTCKEKEITQGKLVADLAGALGLQHVVYSGLENVNKLTGGALKVGHFDTKGEVEEYFWEKGVPMTSVRMAFYYENFLTDLKPVKNASGDYDLVLPMEGVPMDGMAVADIGPVVCSLFQSPDGYIGKAIGLSAERLTAEQYAEEFSKHTGKNIKATKISTEEYSKLGFPYAQEFANMYRFYQMKPDRDIKLTHQLYPKVKNFDQFLTENKDALKDLLK